MSLHGSDTVSQSPSGQIENVYQAATHLKQRELELNGLNLKNMFVVTEILIS